MLHGAALRRARRCVDRLQPIGRVRSDILMKPRRLVDAFVPMFERQRTIAQRAQHRLRHCIVVIDDLLLRDFVFGIEDAIGIGDFEARER